MKHTHTGTCQICGATQAVSVRTGLMAKHGYTTRWGFFSGVCSGADRLPFEVSTDAIADAIAYATRKAADHAAIAAGLRAQTDLAGYFRTYEKDRKGRGGYQDVPATYADTATTMADGYVLRGVEVTFRPFWSHNGTDLVTKDARRAGQYGTTAAACAAESREAIAKIHDRTISGLEEFIGWQNARVAAWKPGQLKAAAPDVARIQVGDTVTVWGKEVQILRIEDKVAHGCGPSLNGRSVPHAFFAFPCGGKIEECATPVCRIRRAKVAA